MGQRHQVYIFYKDEEGKTVGRGFHHQWLFGYWAVKKVEVVMAYAKKALKDKYHPLRGGWSRNSEGALDCLIALYQLNMETGGFNSSVSKLNYDKTDTAEQECVADPRQADNNDGITVYDFRNPKEPAYCMVNIHSQERDWKSVARLTTRTPCTTEEYLRAYYPDITALNDKDKKAFEKVFKASEKLMLMGQSDLAELFPKVFTAQETARKAVRG